MIHINTMRLKKLGISNQNVIVHLKDENGSHTTLLCTCLFFLVMQMFALVCVKMCVKEEG